MTMYYDRRLPESLLGLLAQGQPLGWMVTFVRSPHQPLAHVQFRRAEGTRSRGGIQLYLGRTSPLEVLGCPRSQVEFRADDFYKKLTPNLFGRRFDPAVLAGMSTALDTHVCTSATATHRSFLDGEAISHAGLMRRYGHEHRPGDPIVAVDSEVRIGFGSIGERTTFEEKLRSRVGLKDKKNLPRKLDTIGILADGSIGLVEVKEERGDLARAVVQVAAHVHTFGHLIRQAGYNLAAVLTGMARQKAGVGLLPSLPPVNPEPVIAPVVAAPDERNDWFDIWRRETAAFRTAQADLLGGLRFWRLSPTGELLAEGRP